MSGFFTTFSVAHLAERIVRADNPGQRELDLDHVVSVKDRLVEIMHDQRVEWDEARLTVVQGAILRDWYWYSPTPEGA